MAVIRPLAGGGNISDVVGNGNTQANSEETWGREVEAVKKLGLP
jgi:hypothetical protein